MLPFESSAERPGYCLSCYSERNAGRRVKAQGDETRPFNKPVRQQPARENRLTPPRYRSRRSNKQSALRDAHSLPVMPRMPNKLVTRAT